VTRVIVAVAPGTEPLTYERKWEGMIQCSIRFVVNAIAACGTASTLGDDFAERYDDLEQIPTFVQSERLWEHATPTGASLKLEYADDSPGLDNYRRYPGQSPLMINADNATLETKRFASVGLYMRMFTGDFENTGLCGTVQQKFRSYTSFFHNFGPNEGWLFASDGPHPTP
jgi:hypothetical protein